MNVNIQDVLSFLLLCSRFQHHKNYVATQWLDCICFDLPNTDTKQLTKNRPTDFKIHTFVHQEVTCRLASLNAFLRTSIHISNIFIISHFQDLISLFAQILLFAGLMPFFYFLHKWFEFCNNCTSGFRTHDQGPEAIPLVWSLG